MSQSLLNFVTSVCVQTAVYWGAPTPDGYGGTTFGSPVEIKVRWDGKSQLIKKDNGEEIMSNAEVLLASGQDVDKGGYLYLGSLSDLTAGQQADPRTVDDAYEILQKSENPLFRSTDEFVRQVFL